MIPFAPGPSKVHAQVPVYLQDAYTAGILSANHRSATFMELYARVEQLFREKLGLPEGYRLIFTSSATENWEILSQSLVQEASYHVYSGAFGKKWVDFAQHIHPKTQALKLEAGQEIPVADLQLPEGTELLAITQNETANASAVSMETLRALRERFPEQLIAVDTTSSMGGITLDFSLADCWYASVQKCFGLPAGLGVLLLSPKAEARCAAVGERGRYNSLSFALENARNHQTHYTPNVLGIYLLCRVLEDMPEIAVVDAQTRARMEAWEAAVAANPHLDFHVPNAATRSRTVLAVTLSEEALQRAKTAASALGYQLGGGYGALKTSTFRLANFPAFTAEESAGMAAFLATFNG
ncbi:class V aminotransferase [Nitritalea halalkaliphila LW7]|uniref:Class V aminotransferase n=1 Tax=Nitritalea halalkaliphila LW7 TaxID=1189621 RepID=I5BZ08_9BACT|nr:aminotransferase class V-fold PLP-dependent enzyme [Nitritalea halalkaliphila]EIM74810.1 class V aminotransferase [Nitritalea halalkaliphila LW7]